MINSLCSEKELVHLYVFKNQTIMKKISPFLIVILLLLGNVGSAQILEKIAKAVEKKTEEKTSKTSDKEKNQEAVVAAYGKNKADVSTVPEVYDFSWKYTMKITGDDGKTMFSDYYLEPNAEYYGAKMQQSKSDMFMIMDGKNKLMITSFVKGAEKMASASKMPDYSKTEEGADPKYSKFTYRSLPGKTILGYKCKGIEAVNESYVMTFYYTSEAKVSFAQTFGLQQNQSKTPDALKSFLKPGEKTLVMFVVMKDLTKGGKTTQMECVTLEKQALSFKKAEYKFM
ncbi:hypothetical protein FLJC2902T_10150 [Flavobacterium limnosediminis JC2902]|uniref:DUF4412 domain-containing protein n=1 Tax=Flavobacterium limnosediminis JC2902 TaxID=1341181 RepID=V6SS10_9FLAO|nr:hypothetical protein [Flavobacterium limnosediminis]ESU28982.1 hypothetical protein FLJC2902T_10150 [Flavobacterium limnosediminis JC2902]